MENFPFFKDVDRAFEELKIEAEGSYTPIGGVDSDFSIPFKINGIEYVIVGTIRYGYAHVIKCLEN